MADMQGTATANADLRYGTQISEVRRAIEALLGQTKANVGALEGYGQKGPGAINSAYDILDTKLGENRTQSAKDLGTQADIIGRGYREAQDVSRIQQEASRNSIAELAARMGGGGNYSGYAPTAIAPAEDAVNRIIAQNAMSDATTTGNLRTFAAQNDAILGRGQNIGTKMRADAQGRFQTELLDSLANARLEGIRGQNELTGNLLDIHSERGAFMASEMARLAQEQWQRDIAQAQLDQQAQIANAQLAASQAASSKDDSLGWAQLEQRKLEHGQGMELEYAKLLGSAMDSGADGLKNSEMIGIVNDLQSADETHIKDIIWAKEKALSGLYPELMQLMGRYRPMGTPGAFSNPVSGALGSAFGAIKANPQHYPQPRTGGSNLISAPNKAGKSFWERGWHSLNMLGRI